MRNARLLTLSLVLVVLMMETQALPPTELKYTLPHPGLNPVAEAMHGGSVATDGNLAVVGARYDDTGADSAGVVHVYDATSGALLHRLTDPNRQQHGYFGQAVAVQGTRVAVAAMSDASGIPAGATSRVYVYDLASATPTVPVAVLPNPTPATGDQFGSSIALSGTKVAVGASRDGLDANRSGSVHLFDLAGVSPATPVLTLPCPAGQYGFGAVVAMSGTRLAIGASATGFPISGTGPSGRVYVHDLAGATPGVPVVTLAAPQAGLSDGFGYSVAVSGARVVVGANVDDADGADAGRAYVYDLESATPTVPVAMLDQPGAVAGERFGYAVAISGMRVVVSPYVWWSLGDELIGDPPTGNDPGDGGRAYVYDLASSSPGVPVATLANPTPALGDGFGRAVAIAGERVIIGAPSDDDGDLDTGNAYLFDLSSGPPTAPVAILRSASLSVGDLFGRAVAVSGNIVVVGSPSESAGATRAGRAYVYDLASATPTVPILALSNPTGGWDERFGNAVAVSGTRVAVATLFHQGIVYIYDLASATPGVPIFTLTTLPPAVGGDFGRSMALLGARLVVGVPGGEVAGVNAGYVCVYDLDGATPTVPVTILDNPEPEGFDYFGSAVATSGSRVVVGGYYDGYYDAGRAYVFDLASATPAVPEFTLPNSSLPLHFGSRVAISGDRVAVGAYGEYDWNRRIWRDGVAIYDLAGTSPTSPQTTYNDAGSEVALDGSLIARGSSRIAGGTVALRDPSPYSVSLLIDNPLGPVYGGFGDAVAVDGGTLAVGAPTSAGRGLVHIYQAPTPDAGTLPPTLTSPASNELIGNLVNVAFSLPETARGRSVGLTFQGPVFRWFTLSAPYESKGAHAFSFAPANPMASAAFRSEGGFGSTNLPDGVYTVALSYQDAPGNLAASASVANVRVDTTAPAGGMLVLTPASPVDANAALTVSFAGWTDASLPLAYTVLIDNVVVSPAGATASRNLTGPAPAGSYTLQGRISDALGNVTEVTQGFTVLSAQESWRRKYFGETTNTGTAADDVDPDGDGHSNLFEYVAGLVPNDAGSRFTLRVEPVVGEAGQKAIIFGPVLGGRTYVVKSKASLLDTAWAPLGSTTTSEAGNERTVIDLGAVTGARFYQVEIIKP